MARFGRSKLLLIEDEDNVVEFVFIGYWVGKGRIIKSWSLNVFVVII